EVLDDDHVIADDLGPRIPRALPLDFRGQGRMNLAAILQQSSAADEELPAVLLDERRAGDAAQHPRMRILLDEGFRVERDPQAKAVDRDAADRDLADRDR